MKDKVVIKKYAFAASDSLEGQNNDLVLQELKILSEVFQDNKKLVFMLQSHLTSKQEKNEVIKSIVADLEYKDVWEKLFLLLIKNYRFHLICDIITEIRTYIYDIQNKRTVIIKLAKKEDQEVIPQILIYLKKILKKEIVAEIMYDTSIIGGFRAETEDLIIDGSILNNLKRFTQLNTKNQTE